MTIHRFAFAATLAVAALFVFADIARVDGQSPQAAGRATYSAPRTPWGDPDIQGRFTTDDELTVADPATFSRPWTAALSLRNDPGIPDVFEYACHEGNYAMRNILSAARVAERNK